MSLNQITSDVKPRPCAHSPAAHLATSVCWLAACVDWPCLYPSTIRSIARKTRNPIGPVREKKSNTAVNAVIFEMRSRL